MKGNNELHLCEAAMIQAMQQYVNGLLGPDLVKVVGVSQADDNYTKTFVVKMEEFPSLEVFKK